MEKHEVDEAVEKYNKVFRRQHKMLVGGAKRQRGARVCVCCACELDGPGAQTAALLSCGCRSTCAACAGANFLDILASHDTPENIFKCSGCQQKVTEYRVGPRTVKLPVLKQMEEEDEDEDEAEEMSLFFQDNREIRKSLKLRDCLQEDTQGLSAADFEALMKQTRAALDRGIAEEERRRLIAEEERRRSSLRLIHL